MRVRAVLLMIALLTAVPALAAEAPLPDSIGAATMAPDGTISLQLRAEGKDGTVGDAVLVYRRDDPMYDEVLRHLGGMKPGEAKSVPPWPDEQPAHTR